MSHSATHETVDVRESPEGVTLRVRVTPRAPRESVGGVREGALVVRLQAPPVDGAANRALQRLLGELLGIAPTAVEILRGRSGRDKTVLLRGVGREAAHDLAKARVLR